jgi:hypothetical protein
LFSESVAKILPFLNLTRAVEKIFQFFNGEMGRGWENGRMGRWENGKMNISLSIFPFPHLLIFPLTLQVFLL